MRVDVFLDIAVDKISTAFGAKHDVNRRYATRTAFFILTVDKRPRLNSFVATRPAAGPELRLLYRRTVIFSNKLDLFAFESNFSAFDSNFSGFERNFSAFNSTFSGFERNFSSFN
jgi:hypothetical protein